MFKNLVKCPLSIRNMDSRLLLDCHSIHGKLIVVRKTNYRFRINMRITKTAAPTAAIVRIMGSMGIPV